MIETKIKTMQQPIHSGFNAYTTAEEVIKGIDLTGKIVIVTGGYSGLGKETVRVIRNAGATVIVPTRDINKATETLKDINGIEIEYMDLLNPTSIDAFAEKFLASNRPLHLLINSAGIMANPFTKDTRGFESQFATNHLGHFQLTAKLFPALEKAKGARVVALTSWGHHFSPIIFGDINFEHRDYNKWKAYGQSKTANSLFAVELDKRAKSKNVRAYAVHPGGILDTNLNKYLAKEELQSAGVVDDEGNIIHDPSRNRKNIQQGAATTVWCAVSPQLKNIGGVYCENCDIAIVSDGEGAHSITDKSIHDKVLAYAVDEDEATRLWNVTEEMTGVKFPISEK